MVIKCINSDCVHHNADGELKMLVKTRNGKITIDFGKPVHWIGLDKKTALALANSLKKHAEELPDSTIPYKIVVMYSDKE